jgi:peptidoglycan/xylan/chitin deacetylase (PgdA/CDA1 family)
MAIPTVEIQQSIEKLLELGGQRSPWTHLQLLALHSGLWPAWAEVAERTERYRREFPLQHLATMVVLGPDGRPLPRPDDPEAAREFDEIRRYIEDVQIRLPFIKARILMLRERRAWDESLILLALRSGGLFPESPRVRGRPSLGGATCPDSSG